MEIRALIIYSVLLIAGVVIGSGVTYRFVTTNFYEVHNSNIGGFIFKSGKIYSLEELKDF